jgi:hypothetical protein
MPCRASTRMSARWRGPGSNVREIRVWLPISRSGATCPIPGASWPRPTTAESLGVSSAGAPSSMGVLAWALPSLAEPRISASASWTAGPPRVGEFILWNLATSRLRGERAAAYLVFHRDWIRMGMPAAGRSVTRCFNSGTKLGRKLRRTLRRSVARITTASDRAKLIPMQIRGPAPKGRYA